MGEHAAIILAAGAGTRLKSKKPKVAHEILGKPLVRWVTDAAKEAGIERIVTVVGHGRDQVVPLVETDTAIAVQEEQRGTAHAVLCALDNQSLTGFDGTIVILSGDCPLVRPETIRAMVDAREAAGAAAVVLTMRLADPFGYGRIIRETVDASDGTPAAAAIARIVEQKDATTEEAAVCECNAGFYCFDARLLADALAQVGTDNAQGEFYLTDVIALLRAAGHATIALGSDDATECLGVNSRRQLAEASAIMQARINGRLMDAGVTMIAPELVWCGPDVKVARDVTLHPHVTLMGTVEIGEDTTVLPLTTLVDTRIGEGCTIGPNTRLTDTRIGNDCTVDETIAYEATLDDGATSGPRAYLRPGAHLCEGAKAGTHVEIKKSTIGKGSKVPHLSYIGDTVMGEGVNIGAGSITCNYDGTNKHATTIGDRTFIGSDTMMVAPVNIADDVVVGAGSVITKDVPADALAVARAREKIYDGWVSAHREAHQ